MPRHLLVIAALTSALFIGSAYSQGTPVGSAVLANVEIAHRVLVNGQPLPPGKYEVRLTDDWVDPLDAGEQQGMRWVEFRAEGRVLGREATLVIPASEIGAISAWHPAPGASRVDLLKTGDFIRIWVNRDGTNYLIHLPVSR